MIGLLELANRCEQATGPDAYLDLDVHKAINPDMADCYTLTDAPNYCGSLDAAMRLVPDGWGRHVGNCGEKSCPYACVTRPQEPFTDFTANAATEALALCAASLRARAALAEGNP